MNKLEKVAIDELKDMVKVILDQQQMLIQEIKDIRAEHKKLKEEIELSNFVLNNIQVRKEIMN